MSCADICPNITYAIFWKPFAMLVDASDTAVNIVITQEHEVLDMPAYYYSMHLIDIETMYSTYEK